MQKRSFLPKQLLHLSRLERAVDRAVARELEPQLWSTQQPWFGERMAALKAKIAAKKASKQTSK